MLHYFHVIIKTHYVRSTLKRIQIKANIFLMNKRIKYLRKFIGKKGKMKNSFIIFCLEKFNFNQYFQGRS